MTATIVFSLANILVLPMWVLMIFLRKWRPTRFLIDNKIIPIVLSGIYVFYILQVLISNGMMDFGSLKSVMELFTIENAALAGWIHYLAFDLLIGMWMIDQNKDLNLHQVLMAPCLFLTFMFGPLGFLLFMVLKGLKSNPI
ncbi:MULTISPECIES: ABA4-like family protein [Maribacter]|uniref:ABA4-like family protein n=1 Tax=Maribacter flavus TaxID=1658664 RepID=A0ABU7IL16_9FLAO|nr:MULTISPECIES: ABA4-like family protein [Maribacter]MDC6406540.1 ABA4-like family protein [Maribacter sp. PR66]MEE1973658.1 ABA4-like family protein [Maribacter flavus]